jgi:hypothetical protein
MQGKQGKPLILQEDIKVLDWEVGFAAYKRRF